jgi:acyl-CoA thioester hydrolase
MGGVTVKLRVRFAETDQMGIAHHSSYVIWLEAARVEWLRERGMSYRDIEQSGVSLAVTNVTIDYLRSALFDDELTIDTQLVDAKSRLFRFRYDITRANVRLATAHTTHVSVNAQGKPVRLPRHWLEPLSEQLDSA